MKEGETISKRLRQRELELEWNAMCRRHRRIETAFSWLGILFLAVLCKIGFGPSSSWLLVEVYLLLGLLAVLTLILPLMLFCAWKEWVGYRNKAAYGGHLGARPDATARAKLALLRDFFRETRP